MAAYLTTELAQDYFDERLNTRAWDAASSTDKSKALAHATKIIDSLPYIGRRADSSQTNEFPRHNQTTTPQAVLDACCEIALNLLDGSDPDYEVSQLRVVSQGYSSVRTTYDSDIVPEHIAAGLLSATAYRLLKPYLLDPREINVEKI